MNKLLSAEFVRLFKSGIFRAALGFSAGFAAFAVVIRYIDVTRAAEQYAKLGVEYSNTDGLIFMGGLYLVFAAAVFIGIFVGTEYSDGTIRNKLTAGHSRSSIYLSKWIVCTAADIIIHVMYIAVVLILGHLFIDGTTMPVKEILRFGAVSTVAFAGLTALLLFISMSIQSKAAGSVVCLLTVTVMMFASITIFQKLQEPEYYEAYSYVDEETGEVYSEEREKNPHYLTGTKKEIYTFLNDFLPYSQLYQIAMNIQDNLGVIVLYDCVLIVAATGAGAAIFRRKNLN